MSQIPPYLRIIAGGANNAGRVNAVSKGSPAARPPDSQASAGDSTQPFVICLANRAPFNPPPIDSWPTASLTMEALMENIEASQPAPGDVHANLNHQRALSLLTSAN